MRRDLPRLSFLSRNRASYHSNPLGLVRCARTHEFAADARPRIRFSRIHFAGHFESVRVIEGAAREHLPTAERCHAPTNRGRADWTEVVFDRTSAFRYARESSDLAMKLLEVGVLNRDRYAVRTARAFFACIAVAKLSIQMASDGEPDRTTRCCRQCSRSLG